MIPRTILAAVVPLVLAVAVARGVGTGEDPWVKVSEVDVGLSSVGPVVFLKAKGRAMPIFVDPVVAASIQSALGGPKPARPLSHDLMQTILLAYEAKVTKASITLKDDVFYAELRIAHGGKETTFDSRSSDAIALAVRFDAPIFVREDQLSEAGRFLPDGEERML